MAAAVIERVYLSYRDRQMFTLLKHAVRAAVSRNCMAFVIISVLVKNC